MKLVTPFTLLNARRRYLSFLSEAFDVIKFSNVYVKREGDSLRTTLKWEIL